MYRRRESRLVAIGIGLPDSSWNGVGQEVDSPQAPTDFLLLELLLRELLLLNDRHWDAAVCRSSSFVARVGSGGRGA